MWPLVEKEFVQRRFFFLFILTGLLALGIAFTIVPQAADLFAYSGLFIVYIAVSLPMLIFGQEERDNGLTFLRTLPVHPSLIVTASFMVLLLVSLALAASLLAYHWLSDGTAWQSMLRVMTRVLPIATAVSAFLYFLYFALGAKTARMVLVGLMVGLNILGLVAMFLMTNSAGGRPWMRQLIERVVNSPSASITWPLVGGGLSLVFFLAAIQLFGRRDTSRLN